VNWTVDRMLAVSALGLSVVALALAAGGALAARRPAPVPGASRVDAAAPSPTRPGAGGGDTAHVDEDNPIKTADDAVRTVLELLDMNHKATAALAAQRLDFRLQSLERWAHADPAFRPTRFYTVERWKIPAVYYLSAFGLRDIPGAVRLASLALRPDGNVVKIEGSEIVAEAGAWQWTERGLLIILPPAVPHLGNKTLLFRRAMASADRVDGFHASAIGAKDGGGSSIGLIRDVAYDAGLHVLRGAVRGEYVAETGDALDAVDPEKP
jgi:hypothetical protein